MGAQFADLLGQCGWIIAFVSSVIADIGEDYPNFAWWSLVYMLGCIIGVFVAVATNTIQTYHVAIVGFMSAGLVFTTSSVNSLIYYSEGSKEAAAAGFILLSMVTVWALQTLTLSLHTTNVLLRSSGYSTTAPNPKPPTAAPSTPSPYTKTTPQAAAQAAI